MTSPRPDLRSLARRAFLRRTGLGLGAVALGELLRGSGSRERAAPRHRPRARAVIYLHMAGSPPQQDTFDPKPKLDELDGRPCPMRLIEGKRLAFIKGRPEMLGSPHAFRRVGDAGLEVTELMPCFARIADRATVIRSMTTDQFNHAPAQLLLHTGNQNFGGASMGSWAVYGLGSENRDLPGFVVLLSGGSDPSGGKSLWSSGFLPAHHQATRIRTEGEPVFYLENPAGVSRSTRRAMLDVLREINLSDHARHGDPATLSRIEQFELAFRMQRSVPEACNLADETPETLALYGAEPGRESFANSCLLARRLVERGVRFVQLYDWGWDVHGTGKHDDLLTKFPAKCRETDRASAALVLDLERRGLLDEVLVVWGGEFGRTPMREARNGSTFLGRDHHPGCFSMWLAGGGVKRGHVHGETCELGFEVVRDEVTVRDLQATILHLLGLDPLRFSYPWQGLEQRLVGPAEGPRVVREILA